jgi:hypothetical protein
MAQRAWKLSGGNEPGALNALAAAYAEVGRFADAVRTAEQAFRSAATRNHTLAEQIRARLERYRNGKPWHEPPGR